MTIMILKTAYNIRSVCDIKLTACLLKKQFNLKPKDDLKCHSLNKVLFFIVFAAHQFVSLIGYIWLCPAQQFLTQYFSMPVNTLCGSALGECGQPEDKGLDGRLGD